MYMIVDIKLRKCHVDCSHSRTMRAHILSRPPLTCVVVHKYWRHRDHSDRTNNTNIMPLPDTHEVGK
jgi:hypothetical protein